MDGLLEVREPVVESTDRIFPNSKEADFFHGHSFSEKVRNLNLPVVVFSTSLVVPAHQ
jgi:hypothetical protein